MSKLSAIVKAVDLLPSVDEVTIFVDPYCTIESVLWHLPIPYNVETINDYEGHVVNLFRVFQDIDRFNSFVKRIKETSNDTLAEVAASDYDQTNMVEWGWHFYASLTTVLAAADLGTVKYYSLTGRKRADSFLEWFHDRLTRVQIDCRPFLKVVKYWSHKDGIMAITSFPRKKRKKLMKLIPSLESKFIILDKTNKPLFEGLQDFNETSLSSGWVGRHNYSLEIAYKMPSLWGGHLK